MSSFSLMKYIDLKKVVQYNIFTEKSQKTFGKDLQKKKRKQYKI